MERVGGPRHVEGVDAERTLARQRQLLPGARLVRQHEHAVGRVQQRALLGHEVEPVAHRVDQQDVGQRERGERAGPVVLDGQQDRRPPVRPAGAEGMVDPLGGVHHVGPVGEILGQPLPAGIREGDVHHLPAPLGVDLEQLLEGQHPAHDVLRRLHAVGPGDDAAPAHLGAQRGGRRRARGRRGLLLEHRRVGPERGHERRRGGPPGRGVAGPEAGLPLVAVEAAGPVARPCRRAARPRRRRAARRAGRARRRACARSAPSAGRAAPRPASARGARSGSPARARCRPRPPAPPPRRPRPGCRPGSPPRRRASGGRSGAGAAGRRDGDGSTTASCWRRRRRPAGRCRRRPRRGRGRARPRP